MDLNLNERERMLQDGARDFARKRVKPRAREIDHSGEFPFELMREIAEAGYLGLPFPPAYGGGGAGYLGNALVLEELCQASLTVGAIMAVNTTPQEAVYRFGNQAQLMEMLSPLASGREIGCIAFTEAETGSDPNAIKSLSRRQDNGYIITGHKQFVANAPAARLALVFARSEGEGLNAFVIDTSLAGFNVSPPFETMGLRGLGVCEVSLDDVAVPGSSLLGEAGKGFEILLDAISVERLGVAVQAVGVAQSALELSLEYARERRAMGRPISKLPTIQWHLAEMVTRLEAARWLAWWTAFQRDQGNDIRYQSAKAKLFNTQMAVAVTGMGMQVHGAYGTTKDLDIERLYRDAKMIEIYVGVSEIQRVIIASNLT